MRSAIADGEELTLETRLNGQVMKHATTEQMIHRIPRLINYISAFTTLEPGDVIVTGTPGGVGARRNPPVWMKPGDTVEIEVSKVGGAGEYDQGGVSSPDLWRLTYCAGTGDNCPLT